MLVPSLFGICLGSGGVFMIQVNRTVFIAGPKKISIKFVTVVELHFLGAFARMGETIQSLAGVTT